MLLFSRYFYFINRHFSRKEMLVKTVFWLTWHKYKIFEPAYALLVCSKIPSFYFSLRAFFGGSGIFPFLLVKLWFEDYQKLRKEVGFLRPGERPVRFELGTLQSWMYFEHYPISGQCSHFILLKTAENLWFSGVFRGIKWEHFLEMS